MMDQTIREFNAQFGWQPVVENTANLKKPRRVIVAGMGGSHLAAGIIKTWDPSLDISIHNDYGLPALPETTLKDCLIIASSYSGNTEETIDCLTKATEQNLAIAVITTGGKLLELAQAHSLPHVIIPATGIQPRSALGYSTMALLALLGDTTGQAELAQLATSLKPEALEQAGKDLAEKLKSKTPIIYASKKNASLTYNWKIKFNETGKVPAFANVLPEVNHNEMQGYPTTSGTSPYHFIFLRDDADHPQIQKRFEILKQLLTKQGYQIEEIKVEGATKGEKIFNNLLLADWTAYHTALAQNLDPEQVPLIEEFKNLLK